MPRIRTIKPSFFLDEEIADLRPLARLLFVALWTLADREGRLEDRPRRIRVQALPYDDVDADELLDELAEAGFIVRYEAAGRRLIQIRNFSRHQCPNAREPESELPAPPDGAEQEAHDHARARTCAHVRASWEREGEREQSREAPDGASCAEAPDGAGASAPQPEDDPVVMNSFPIRGEPGTWGVRASKLMEWCETFPDLDVEAELRKARQWLRDNPARQKTARGMARFLFAWLERAQNRGRGQPRASPGRGGVDPHVGAERQPRWGFAPEDRERFEDHPRWDDYLEDCSARYGWEAERGPWPRFEAWLKEGERCVPT